MTVCIDADAIEASEAALPKAMAGNKIDTNGSFCFSLVPNISLLVYFPRTLGWLILRCFWVPSFFSYRSVLEVCLSDVQDTV